MVVLLRLSVSLPKLRGRYSELMVPAPPVTVVGTPLGSLLGLMTLVPAVVVISRDLPYRAPLTSMVAPLALRPTVPVEAATVTFAGIVSLPVADRYALAPVARTFSFTVSVPSAIRLTDLPVRP